MSLFHYFISILTSYKNPPCRLGYVLLINADMILLHVHTHVFFSLLIYLKVQLLLLNFKQQDKTSTDIVKRITIFMFKFILNSQYCELHSFPNLPKVMVILCIPSWDFRNQTEGRKVDVF